MNPEAMTDEYLQAVEEEQEHFPRPDFVLWMSPGGSRLLRGWEASDFGD